MKNRSVQISSDIRPCTEQKHLRKKAISASFLNTSLLEPILSWEREKINGDCQVPYLHTFNMTDPFSHLLSLQRLLNLLFLPFQIILFFIQIITLFAEFFHVLQLRPHSLPAIWLNLFIFPGQITDCIIVFLYLLLQTYPVY